MIENRKLLFFFSWLNKTHFANGIPSLIKRDYVTRDTWPMWWAAARACATATPTWPRTTAPPTSARSTPASSSTPPAPPPPGTSGDRGDTHTTLEKSYTSTFLTNHRNTFPWSTNASGIQLCRYSNGFLGKKLIYAWKCEISIFRGEKAKNTQIWTLLTKNRTQLECSMNA